MNYDEAIQFLGLTTADNLNRTSIQTAYKIQSLKFHPDNTRKLSKTVKKEYEERFKQINEANELLKNIFIPSQLNEISDAKVCLNLYNTMSVTARRACVVALLESSEAARNIILTEMMKSPKKVRESFISDIPVLSAMKKRPEYVLQMELIKREIESIMATKLAYKPASITSSRYHYNEATGTTNSNINREYQYLRGDVLKTAILEGFKASLQGCSPTEVQEKIDTFKESDEYNILKKGQDITTRLFHLKTDSIKAFEKISLEAQKGSFANEPKLEGDHLAPNA